MSSLRPTSRSWWFAKPSARQFRSPGWAARSQDGHLRSWRHWKTGARLPETAFGDYEVGLKLGALGLKTMFVRIPATPGERGVVATRGHFPATLGDAVRQKARWLGGIALSGWDRLGWSGGLGERWMRMRDRRGPLAALLLLAAYSAAFLWSQLWLAEALGAPVQARMDPALTLLLTINFWLLAWRAVMRACFTASAYGWA